MPITATSVCFRGKEDIGWRVLQCLLLAQSGHLDALNQCPLGKADIHVLDPSGTRDRRIRLDVHLIDQTAPSVRR